MSSSRKKLVQFGDMEAAFIEAKAAAEGRTQTDVIREAVRLLMKCSGRRLNVVPDAGPKSIDVEYR